MELQTLERGLAGRETGDVDRVVLDRSILGRHLNPKLVSLARHKPDTSLPARSLIDHHTRKKLIYCTALSQAQLCLLYHLQTINSLPASTASSSPYILRTCLKAGDIKGDKKTFRWREIKKRFILISTLLFTAL